MSLIQGISSLRHQNRPSVVSIGNFDGVHKGHQHVVQTLLNQAEELSLKSTIVTFEPLAREFFAPGSIARLSTLEEKAEILFELGVDQVLSIEFDDAFSHYSPERFIQEVLLDGLGTQFLSVGDDFRFGHQREGDFDTLRKAGDERGFRVQKHDTILLRQERVSSGRIRKALEEHELSLAAELLGQPYSISGIVSEGQKLGRTLSFPTANVVLGDRRVPVAGVYAVRVAVDPISGASNDSRALIPGVVNVGVRPTVDGKEQRLEAHLFDFEKDIYGMKIRVDFIKQIRCEKKFESLEALKTQIKRDADEARRILMACR
ncbi:MAG TPA: bifunctional riboflavin kinase/FAD synthetase [Gammaproteobacteria bacterium]|nr:bifunctional riboflavin kinase/FAD synthetase [Gammaproteobacteria bacterium]